MDGPFAQLEPPSHAAMTSKIMVMVLYLTPLMIILALATRASYNHWFHPLASHPGPWYMGISRVWWLWHSLRGDLHRQLVLLHRRYGQTVRIAPDEISYTHPGLWKEIYAARPGQLAYERDTRDFINGVPDILSSDRFKHAHIRRQLSHGFSDKALREQEPVVQGYINELVKQLDRRCEVPQNISLWMNLCAFDATGRLVFGEDFGSLSKEALDPYILMVFNAIKYLGLMRALNRLPGIQIVMRNLLPLALSMRDLFVSKAMRDARRQQERRTRDMVDRRRMKEPEFTDIIGQFVKATAKGDFTLPELYQNSDLILLAGSETTASAVSAALFYLTTHRSKMARLVKEVRGAFANYADITVRDITALCPYLLAVLNESLRLYPPPASIFHRVVREEGDIIGDRFVPGGTAVGVNPFASGRDPLNWNRPDEFAPERWLDGEEDFANDRREVHQPFGGGPRNCVGRNLAYTETKSILAKLVWSFDFELEPESRNWMDLQDVWLGWYKGPLMMRLKRAARDVE